MKTEKIVVESKVSSVTVYQGRAMITRSARLSLNAGTQVLVFADLPSDIEEESIQVRGTGEAVLGDCSFETEYFTEDLDEKRNPLLREQEAVHDAVIEEQLKIDACARDNAFLDKIAMFVTTPPKNGSGPGSAAVESAGDAASSSSWEKMLLFYQEKHTGIDETKLKAERRIRDLNRKLEAIQSRITALGGGSARSRNIIKVNLAKEKDGEVAVDLSYMLSGPSWSPVYNVRAVSDGDGVAFEYDALVTQATGEAWDDVELKLSTARVNVSGVIPELSPWRLSLYRPQPSRYAVSKRRMQKEDDEIGEYGKMAEVAASEPAMMMDMEYTEIRTEEAAIETGGTSVVFTVVGGGSIGGDNNDSRVTVMRRDLPSVFHYTTVPKLSEFAYLTALMENTSEFPFLPGRMNIFFDGNFVAASELHLVMPGEKTEVSLGIDEGIKVEYRFLKRFRKNEGMLDKRISEEFDYQIRLTNNRGKKVSIKVFDQFPFAQQKEITVKPVAPLIKSSTEALSIDDENRIQWFFEIAPGEKREIPYSFIVDYPRMETLYGL